MPVSPIHAAAAHFRAPGGVSHPFRQVSMRKLSLEIESLEVDSFQTAPAPHARGTAYAHVRSNGCDAHDPVVHIEGTPTDPPPVGTGYPPETCWLTCVFTCGCVSG